MTDIKLKIADNTDIDGVLALQSKYLLANTPQDKLANGFVTTPFTVQQLEELISLQGLFLAVKDEQVVAYVVSASWQYLAQWPIFVHMVSLFDEFTYQGEKMTVENSYQYGPICIDESARGTGLLKDIFEFARVNMAKRYPYSLTFVNKKNKRSYAAHAQKLKLDQIREFAFNGNEFHMMGFLTQV